MPLAPWPRKLHRPSERPAHVLFFLFGTNPLPRPLPLSRERHGIPDNGPHGQIGLCTHTFTEDPRWFGNFFRGSLRALGEEALGESFEVVADAAYCFRIEGELADPADLGYLQSAWALARCICEAGASAVLDAHAARWHAAIDLLESRPDRPFDLDRETTFVFESDETPGHGHLMHTRGLAKFGRPDIILADLPEDGAEHGAKALREVGLAAAHGATLRAGRPVKLPSGEVAHLEPYTPGHDGLPDLRLNNEGLLLRFKSG